MSTKEAQQERANEFIDQVRQRLVETVAGYDHKERLCSLITAVEIVETAAQLMKAAQKGQFHAVEAIAEDLTIKATAAEVYAGLCIEKFAKAGNE